VKDDMISSSLDKSPYRKFMTVISNMKPFLQKVTALYVSHNTILPQKNYTDYKIFVEAHYEI
jgi:hypothetical protein